MVLFVASREVDYLQDLTYAGLSDVLGTDHVLDVPWQWRYHRPREHWWSPAERYPRTLGFVGSDRAPRGLALVDARRALADGRVRLLVLGSAKVDALDALAALLDAARCPWIFVDGGDRPEIGGDFERRGGDLAVRRFHDLYRSRPPGLVFKRELAPGAEGDDVLPLPFSIHTGRARILDPRAPKRHQVVFWGVESSLVRREALQLLRGRYDCEANGSVPGQKPRRYRHRGDGYFEALARARIALSFRGGGFDTLRYWEAPAAGALLLSEPATIRIPEDFVPGRHAVFCRPDLSDLLSLIDYYLAHDEERLAIATAGQAHLLGHHTHVHRARGLLEAVANRLGVRLEPAEAQPAV